MGGYADESSHGIAAVLIACAVLIGGIVMAKVRTAGTTVTNTPIPN